MKNKYRVGVTVDIGCDREKQEDFARYVELDEENLLCIVADGTGSKDQHPQPAALAVLDIAEILEMAFREERDLFLMKPQFFLKYAMVTANRLLGAFKMGNEEIYSGYAASVTCCLFSSDYRIFAAHAGNTRLYIMREGKLRQVTHDHTKAADLLKRGMIGRDAYYTHPDRLKLTSGIGMFLEPEIQCLAGRIKPTDLVIMSTDGIHYAVREAYWPTFILRGTDCVDASKNLVLAAKEVRYPDNMTAMVIHGNPDVPN